MLDIAEVRDGSGYLYLGINGCKPGMIVYIYQGITPPYWKPAGTQFIVR